MKEQADTDNVRTRWSFPAVWAVGIFLLIGLTWRLWFPLPWGDFPVTGWTDGTSRLRWLGLVSSVVVILAAMQISLNGVRGHGSRASWWIVALGLAVGFLVDQHRLQPWAYQSFLYAVVFATFGPIGARRLLIPLAASIYIYSALGKLDYQFAYTVGQDFLSALLSPVGGFPDGLDEENRAKLALVMPVSELLVGFGLLLPWSRKLAGLAAIGLHLTLIAILGPWSLNHSPGVLGWNVLLIVQSYYLFIQPARANQKQVETPETTSSVRSIAICFVAVALLMPAFERAGYWDHWLSWSLYSPHTSRVVVEFHRSELDKLPQSVRDHLAGDDDQDGWSELSLSAWSLGKRGVPVYPQARYQLAVIRQVCQQYGIDDGVRVIQKGVADRWTGRRDENRMLGANELR